MTVYEMIAKAVKSGKCPQSYVLPELPCEPVTAICAVTGIETKCLPRKKVIGVSFTDTGGFVCPESDFIGVDVFIAWRFGYPGNEGSKRLKYPESMSSWSVSADGEFFELDRKQVRDCIIKYPCQEVLEGDPWAMYVTTSYKKHGSIHTKVNTGSQAIIRFEMLDVDCSDRMKLMEIWDRLNIEIRKGLGRSILETLDCPISVMGKVGIDDWINFVKWARPLFRSPLYKFILYLLPSQQELKDEKELDKQKNPDRSDKSEKPEEPKDEPLRLAL